MLGGEMELDGMDVELRPVVFTRRNLLKDIDRK